MFDNNSVPTRIVINGTATMRLSDRFKRLSAVKSKPVATFVDDQVFDGVYEPLPRVEHPPRARLYINPIHRRIGYRRQAPRYERTNRAIIPDEKFLDFDQPPAPRLRQTRLYMPPIQHRLSFKREFRVMPHFSFPNNHPNNFHQFPRRQQRRYGRGGFWNRGRGRNHRGEQRDGRKKLTLEELDRELEQYMAQQRSSKHPRISV